MKGNINRWLYIGFVLFGFYMIVFRQAFSDAVTFFGIALAFDPFDQAQPWKERPFWQKAWLFVHLGIVAALFGYEIGFHDSVK
jgi:H+/Cl- antiporter ClcA